MGNDLTIKKETGSAIAARRECFDLAINILDSVEKRIYEASVKEQIKDISNEDLPNLVEKMFKMIFFDCGYKQTDDADLKAYHMTRLQSILTTYYRHYTLAEIRLAFELCMMGELDNFLPRDSQGNPDRKHYQQFNMDYISRVMRAYSSRRGIVFDKVFTKANSDELADNSLKNFYHNAILHKIKSTFEKYRDTGVLEIPRNSEFFILSWLTQKGFAGELTITDEDRKKAYFDYIHKAQKGLVNKFDEYKVRLQGRHSEILDFPANVEAAKKTIKKAFDTMIEGEENIDRLITFR